MSSIKKKNQASLQSFFKPVQPPRVPIPPAPLTTSTTNVPTMPSSPASSPATFKAPSNFPHPAFGSSKPRAGSNKNVKPALSQTAKPVGTQQSYTSSLSPPPSSSDLTDAPTSPPKPVAQTTPVSTRVPSDREIKGSDEEGSDSDGSIEDLTAALQAHSSSNQPRTSLIHSKPTRSARVQISPLVVPKYKFDLKALARHAEKDDAVEASSKRVKAMAASTKNAASTLPTVSNTANTSRLAHHNELLESVVAETEGAELHKVTRALDRTEATLLEHRWYFFGTRSQLFNSERSAFPAKSITDNWRDDLKDPKARYQTFVSGFAEDMVVFGKSLPDEIFMWMIDELCSEPNDTLRSSYSNVLRASSEQVNRLLVADVIRKMFRALGGSLTAITISEVIHPVQEISKPYTQQNWAKLHSLVKFFGQASKAMGHEARVHAICMLLRMAVDRVVSDNVDLYDLMQETILRLCKPISSEAWESFCQEICRTMFNCVEQATFRLQLVEILPSTSPRTHDLRRRLAMCFYFQEISYSMKHSHHTMDLNLFIDRLHDKEFEATPKTDYRELAALISLLDIAVDDARSVGLDLADRTTEEQFDEDVETFAATIKNIMKSIGTPGPGFFSKIEAKETLELVSQRIGDTLRSRPKLKQSLFEEKAPRPKEDLTKEKSAMDRFLSRTNAGRSKGSTPDSTAG